MAKERKVIKVVTSGHPEIYPNVDIYDTVLEHIAAAHPTEFARLDEVYNTIEDPDRIHQSKTKANSVILVNESITSAGGDSLRIPIKVLGSEAIMQTAHYSGVTDQGALIWARTRRGSDDED